MAGLATAPDVSTLEIPMDAWTQPFWEATAQGRIILPHCTSCGEYRWPPGPYCPTCHKQEVRWTDSGGGRIYSYTVVQRPGGAEGEEPRVHVPALIEFPDAGGVRLVAAIVDTPVQALSIGAMVEPAYSAAANGFIPVFRMIGENAG